MTSKQKQRFALVVLLVLGVGTGVALALTAFNENLQLFYDPTQIVAGEVPKNKTIRVGGLVQNGTVVRSSDSLKIVFILTDTQEEVKVEYTGILPDLFREGQGIIAIGELQEEGYVIATEVLAKHDENYMPPEVEASLNARKEK